jgi:hypothetical protein
MKPRLRTAAWLLPALIGFLALVAWSGPLDMTLRNDPACAEGSSR